jgi:hypothetical protein
MNGALGNADLLLSMTQQAPYCQHEKNISKTVSTVQCREGGKWSAQVVSE